MFGPTMASSNSEDVATDELPNLKNSKEWLEPKPLSFAEVRARRGAGAVRCRSPPGRRRARACEMRPRVDSAGFLAALGGALGHGRCTFSNVTKLPVRLEARRPHVYVCVSLRL